LKVPANPATGALVVPEGFDLRKPWPLLIVSVPGGGRSISMMQVYTNAALSLGYAVLACDGPQLDQYADSMQVGWGMLSSVLEQMVRTWPQTKGWPMICAGFSGGAKKSAGMAAAMMHENYRLGGVFMAGSNEDRASYAVNYYQPGEGFKLVPMFLSNGSSDPIAGPDPAAAVKFSMQRFGFRNLRAEIYEGGHQLNQAHLKSALEWFKSRLPQSTAKAK
jgi:predicted esterase